MRCLALCYTSLMRINWTAGILSAIVVAVVGMLFFVFVGSKIDYTCHNTDFIRLNCRVANGVSAGIGGYTDIFRSIFAKRCVGGVGPDDCLGPDGMIMLGTLLVFGFVGGNLVWRKKQ